MLTCPAAELVDGSNVLYYEQVSTTVQFCVSSFGLIVFNISMPLKLAQSSFSL